MIESYYPAHASLPIEQVPSSFSGAAQTDSRKKADEIRASAVGMLKTLHYCRRELGH